MTLARIEYHSPLGYFIFRICRPSGILYLCRNGEWRDAGGVGEQYYFGTREAAQEAVMKWEATFP